MSLALSAEQAVRAAAVEAQKAAERSTHDPDYRREPLCKLFERLDREAHGFYEAVLSGDAERTRRAIGGLVWTATMIADHGLMLGEARSGEEEHGI